MRDFLPVAIAALVVGSALVAGPTMPARADSPDAAGSAAPELPDEEIVEVMFVTDRSRGDGDSPKSFFGDRRGDPSFGRCTIKFSRIPGLSSLSEKAPFYVPGQRRKVTEITELPPLEFWRIVEQELASPERKLVISLHGYNMDFLKACSRAAIIQRSLAPAARLVLYSWPSDGNVVNYARDEADMAWSVPHLEAFLSEIVQRAGRGRAQLLVHSLGSRGTVAALERMACCDDEMPLFDQFVMVAPDIDSDTFAEQLPRLIPVANAITLYASDHDNALRVSREVHGYPRLGEAGEHLTVLEGMETIDVSTAPAFEISGHLYHLFNPHTMADIRRLLLSGESAARRPGLERRTHDGLVYWALTPRP